MQHTSFQISDLMEPTKMLCKVDTVLKAMKGDIAVSYGLNESYYLKSFNAMIHLEYLPGDSVLTNKHSTDSSMHLAR